MDITIIFKASQDSSVVEHPTHNRTIAGSNLPGGSWILSKKWNFLFIIEGKVTKGCKLCLSLCRASQRLTENLEDRWKVNFPLVSQDFPLVSQNFPWVSHVLSMGLPSSQKLPEAENLFWQVAEWFCGSIEQGANKKEKIMKFWFCWLSGLWFGLHDLRWPFIIFLKSLIPKKASGMQKCCIQAL